jgi:cytochrome c-type biogenesis protein
VGRQSPAALPSRTVAFVLGFSVIFIIFGTIAAALGSLLFDLRFILEKAGGIVVVIFGLHMIGVFRIRFLEYDTRVQQMPDRKWGYFSSALMGVFFAGWALRGTGARTILTFASMVARSRRVSLSAYSAGLATILVVPRRGWVSVILRKYGKAMHYIEIAMGVILVILGVMLFAGIFEVIAQQGQFFWFDFGI